MRILMLMRHVKSSWQRPELDIARPLAPRGHEAAPLLARDIGQSKWQADVVLCSRAERVRASGPRTALARLRNEVPTAALAVTELDLDSLERGHSGRRSAASIHTSEGSQMTSISTGSAAPRDLWQA